MLLLLLILLILLFGGLGFAVNHLFWILVVIALIALIADRRGRIY